MSDRKRAYPKRAGWFVVRYPRYAVAQAYAWWRWKRCPPWRLPRGWWWIDPAPLEAEKLNALRLYVDTLRDKAAP